METDQTIGFNIFSWIQNVIINVKMGIYLKKQIGKRTLISVISNIFVLICFILQNMATGTSKLKLFMTEIISVAVYWFYSSSYGYPSSKMENYFQIKWSAFLFIEFSLPNILQNMATAHSKLKLLHS